MTYDFNGAWADYAGELAPMEVSPDHPYKNNPVLGKYCIGDAIRLYESYGVPLKKFTLGMPLYGRT